MASGPESFPRRGVKIVVAADRSEFSETGAALFSEAARNSIDEKGWFAVALSGGSTPRPVHRRLGRDPYRSTLPWDCIHLFWADERMVAPTDPLSNYGALKQDLLRHIPIPTDQVHPMPTTGPLEVRARFYESELCRFFGSYSKKGPLFDLILLGLGADGHVASLFPETPLTSGKTRLTTLVHGGNPDTWRLSLTLEAINATRRLIFLVSGLQKASIVSRVILDRNGDLPAQKVFPLNGEMLYLLDAEAAVRLPPALCNTKTHCVKSSLKPKKNGSLS